MKHHSGLTLIELIIVLVIVSILATLAIPSYQQYMFNSRRSEAISALLGIQLAEEKFRTNNIQYGNLAAVWGGGYLHTGRPLYTQYKQSQRNNIHHYRHTYGHTSQ